MAVINRSDGGLWTLPSSSDGIYEIDDNSLILGTRVTSLAFLRADYGDVDNILLTAVLSAEGATAHNLRFRFAWDFAGDTYYDVRTHPDEHVLALHDESGQVDGGAYVLGAFGDPDYGGTGEHTLTVAYDRPGKNVVVSWDGVEKLNYTDTVSKDGREVAINMDRDFATGGFRVYSIKVQEG